ncbi:MAG: hypothetical protein SGARI_002761 [Bacillariaceae sp.]
MADDQFFAAPPAEETPAGEDAGFALVDVQEAGEDMGFAGGAAPVDDAFAAPPAVEEDVFVAPPAEDAPIVLGAPPAEESPDAVETVEDETGLEAVSSTPSAMVKWNEEWQVTLSARKEEENAKKKELVDAAAVAMAEFQKERELKRESKMSKNREDEQAKLEAIEADLENDNSWQRVCKMVDLTADGAEAGEDTKKMRDVFIMLKNEQGLAAKVGA